MIYAVLKIEACEVTNHFLHICFKTMTDHVVATKLSTMSVFTHQTVDGSVYSVYV